jgi:hypothetical protein
VIDRRIKETAKFLKELRQVHSQWVRDMSKGYYFGAREFYSPSGKHIFCNELALNVLIQSCKKRIRNYLDSKTKKLK